MAIYEYKTKIRYSEVDKNGILTFLSLLDLFQNCSLFQSEELGVGVGYLKEMRRAWVLSSWQICIDDLPRFNEPVTVKTWSHGIKGTFGNRNFTLENEGGDVLCYANSLWIYIDTDTLKPVKCPADEADKYGISPCYEMECAPRKIALPDNLKSEDSFCVKRYFIDTNGHMNNEKYVLAASDFLPDDFKVSMIRAEYKKQAHLGDMIYPKTSLDDNVMTVALYGADNELYATVQFTAKS